MDNNQFKDLVEKGKNDREIAEFFNVSPQAVWAKRKRMEKKHKLTKALPPLTTKQQEFVEKMTTEKRPKGLEVVKEVYGITDNKQAQMQLQRTMNSPAVREAITTILDRNGITRDMLTKKLKTHINSSKAEISIKAVDMGFKLHDDYPASKNVNLNVNLEWLPVDLNEFLPQSANGVDNQPIDDAQTAEFKVLSVEPVEDTSNGVVNASNEVENKDDTANEV